MNGIGGRLIGLLICVLSGLGAYTLIGLISPHLAGGVLSWIVGFVTPIGSFCWMRSTQ